MKIYYTLLFFVSTISSVFAQTNVREFWTNYPTIEMPLILDEAALENLWDLTNELDRIPLSYQEQFMKIGSHLMFEYEDTLAENLYFYGKLFENDNYFGVLVIEKIMDAKNSSYLGVNLVMYPTDSIAGDVIEVGVKGVLENLYEEVTISAVYPNGDVITNISDYDILKTKSKKIYTQRSKEKIIYKISDSGNISVKDYDKAMPVGSIINFVSDSLNYPSGKLNNELFTEFMKGFPKLKLPLNVDDSLLLGKGAYIEIDSNYTKPYPLLKILRQINDETAPNPIHHYLGKIEVSDSIYYCLFLSKYPTYEDRRWMVSLGVFTNRKLTRTQELASIRISGKSIRRGKAIITKDLLFKVYNYYSDSYYDAYLLDKEGVMTSMGKQYDKKSNNHEIPNEKKHCRKRAK